MLESFSILNVTREMREGDEPLGSKRKFWFQDEGEKWLFKEARENTGEDWAEKIASEIAALLELPTHRAELAVCEGKKGCAVHSFLSNRQVLVHGNELLGGLITGYDKEKHKKQTDHTFANIERVLERIFTDETPRHIALEQMVGYLFLDALVGNTDRHHQNWGVILEILDAKENQLTARCHLAPTFDHASSLGRELTDESRERYLRDNSIDRYIHKGRGGIFEHPQSKHGMSPLALAQKLATQHPVFFRSWQTRLAALRETQWAEMFKRLPAERASQMAGEFALAYLKRSRNLLLSL